MTNTNRVAEFKATLPNHQARIDLAAASPVVLVAAFVLEHALDGARSIGGDERVVAVEYCG